MSRSLLCGHLPRASNPRTGGRPTRELTGRYILAWTSTVACPRSLVRRAQCSPLRDVGGLSTARDCGPFLLHLFSLLLSTRPPHGFPFFLGHVDLGTLLSACGEGHWIGQEFRSLWAGLFGFLSQREELHYDDELTGKDYANGARKTKRRRVARFTFTTFVACESAALSDLQVLLSQPECSMLLELRRDVRVHGGRRW